MPYVKDHSDSPAQGLRVPGMSEKYREDGLDFPESGILQVDTDTMRALVQHCPPVQEYSADDNPGDDRRFDDDA